MPRIRTIKPDFWTDEKIGRLKRDVRLLFIGLWNLSDDQGVIKSSASYIKGQLFSCDEELRVNTVSDWLTSLVSARMLVPFEYLNEGYYFIRTFEDHQVINRPSKSRFPETLLNELKNTHGVCSEYSQPEGKGMEGNKERKGSGDFLNFSPKNEKKIISPPPEITLPFSDQFTSLWVQWRLYKDKEFKFKYKSSQSEQAAIDDLIKKSNGHENTAIEIIKQSMANGWKGFFELKINSNGTKSISQQKSDAATTFLENAKNKFAATERAKDA